MSLTGDFCPTFFGYGPFVSYLLTGLYAAARGLLKVLAGWSDSDFFYRAIFEPTPFYAAGRVLHALADVAAVAVAARVAMRHAGLAAGWAVLALGAAPLLQPEHRLPDSERYVSRLVRAAGRRLRRQGGRRSEALRSPRGRGRRTLSRGQAAAGSADPARAASGYCGSVSRRVATARMARRSGVLDAGRGLRRRIDRDTRGCESVLDAGFECVPPARPSAAPGWAPS